MGRSEWEEIRENVMNSFQDGEKDGRDPVEVTTGLLWFERQTNHTLRAALEEILRVARGPLDRERPASSEPDNLLQMVIEPSTGRPSHHHTLCNLIQDRQNTPHEVPASKAAVENCASDPGQYACPDTTKL